MGTKITIILYFSLSLQIKDVKARMIDQIIDYNKTFVAQKGYEKYLTIKTHPLVPKEIIVRGFIIDSETGALEEISC